MKILKVRLTMIETTLGTASCDPKIHEEFVASKSPNPATIEDEVAAIGVEATVMKAKTVFPKEDGRPFVYDYQIRGFLKEAAGMMARVPDSLSSELKAHRKVVDGLVFVYPRKIMWQLPPGGVIGDLQRPIIAQTAQGQRIALANSESVPAGSVLELEIWILNEKHEKLVREWLDYGAYKGLGQWRNSGKGQFTWEEILEGNGALAIV